LTFKEKGEILKSMKIKSKDIARNLGLSTTTVSMALSGKKNISQQTRERIFDYIERNGGDVRQYYHPDETERATICLVCYRKNGKVLNEASPFFMCLLEGFQKEALKVDYHLVTLWYDELSAGFKYLVSQINALSPAGLVVIATEMNPEDTELFEDTGIPTVYIDNSFQDIDVDTVSINNRKVVEVALNTFKKNGHERIGYLRSSIETDAFLARSQWLRVEAERKEMTIDSDYIISLSPVMQEAMEEMREYLKGHKGSFPSAFFADTDQIAIGAIKALQEVNAFAEKEISVIGFENHPMGEMLDPPLSTLNIVKQDMAAMAINCLKKRIEKGIENHMAIYISATYVERGTVYNRAK